MLTFSTEIRGVPDKFTSWIVNFLEDYSSVVTYEIEPMKSKDVVTVICYSDNESLMYYVVSHILDKVEATIHFENCLTVSSGRNYIISLLLRKLHLKIRNLLRGKS
jgi:hypothetical protein